MGVYNNIANGLFQAIEHEKGFGKAKRVKYYVAPVPMFSAIEIKNLRNNLGLSQVLFAGVVGVSPKSVEAWESGRNTPEGAARRILGMLAMDPEFLVKYKIVTA